MSREKFLKKITKHADNMISEAYSEGYSDGFNDGEQAGYDGGLLQGIIDERDRIIALFKSRSQEELVNGSASKAKAFAAAAELVAVAYTLEQMDWSEEGIEKAYQEELEKDGF